MIESSALYDTFAPVARESLSDRLAMRIHGSICDGRFRCGERLPPIAVMARSFGVGAGSVREALTKLEMLRVVEVRHGLGVFVVATFRSPKSSSAA